MGSSVGAQVAILLPTVAAFPARMEALRLLAQYQARRAPALRTSQLALEGACHAGVWEPHQVGHLYLILHPHLIAAFL